VLLALAVSSSLHCGGATRLWAGFLTMAALASVSRPSWLIRLHDDCRGHLQARSAKQAAAGIAGLVGFCSTEEALELAMQRFRSISLAELRYEDIADNRPDTDLFARSMPTKLTQCDAFISHSWSDDSAAKWAALQRWRADFVAKHDREPTIWLDKCCIDQTNIDADLRCLPIFLWGCQEMVVFCGETYLSRLWCIMEIFTFVHIGRGVDRMRFVPVASAGDAELGTALTQAALQQFDINDCNCFLQQDKDKMLSIVRAAFNGLHGFNLAVQKIFEDAGLFTPSEQVVDCSSSQASDWRSSDSSADSDLAPP